MKSSSEIEEVCREYNIRNYTINDDGSIDANGDVNLINRGLTELPLDFNRVSGNFFCSYNELTTLKGSPKYVGDVFYCGYNDLSSLEFGPIEVGGEFDCSKNKLTSLEFGPIEVGGSFYCSYNELTSLEFSPKEVGGDFYCYNNPKLTNLYGISDNINGLLYCVDTPLESIFNEVDIDFIKRFNSYKVIKDNKVNLKRLKYFMELFDIHYNLNKIEKHYEII